MGNDLVHKEELFTNAKRQDKSASVEINARYFIDFFEAELRFARDLMQQHRVFCERELDVAKELAETHCSALRELHQLAVAKEPKKQDCCWFTVAITSLAFAVAMLLFQGHP